MATKLYAPAVRQKRVARPKLIERLRADSLPKLTLVDGPAGSGKTTLLADWHSTYEVDSAFAWLALDRGDDDPVRFWTYVVEALRTVALGVGAQALALLRAPGAGLVELALTTLVNELRDVAGPLILVLDDYHMLTNSDIHAGMSFLIEHQPPGLRLVIATRSDPPIPLARLRARGDLLEVRADDLRFSQAETGTFLNDVLGLGLDEADILRLHERTEGWAAGLYLSALWLRDRTDAHQFIQAFAGDDRHIVDYLGSEVLAHQPEEVRRFLLHTSILDRLTGPLCDAVCGTNRSEAMLVRIERSNLFLVPLDVKRRWYRYHHLFRELLRHELDLTEPELVPILHRRASTWYRSQDAPAATIRHLIAGEDFAEAVELIARHWNGFFNQGRLATVASWLDALPSDVLRGEPRLCLARAWLAMDSARLDDVEPWVEATESSLANLTDNSAASLRFETATLRAVYSFKIGDLGEAREAAVRALAPTSTEASFWRTAASCALGVSLFWTGNAPDAEHVLQQTVRLARSTGNDLAAAYALGYLAFGHAEQGKMDQAERDALAALHQSAEPGFGEHFVLMLAHGALGLVYARRDESEAARAEIARMVELARRGAGRIELALGLIMRAQLLQNDGDRAGALAVLQEADQIAETCPNSGSLGTRLLAAKQGRGEAASRHPATRVILTEDLTERELAVLRLLPSRLSQREIGAELYVSLNTVKTHVRGIYSKLQAPSRDQAVARARELRLL